MKLLFVDILVTIPGVLLSVGLKALAQAPPVDPSLAALLNLGGNLSVTGVLVWHMWYHTTRTYPQMQAKFATDLEKIRDKADAALIAAQAAYAQEMAAERKRNSEQMDAERSRNREETKEWRAMLGDNLREYRRAVHDIKDTANAAVLAKAKSDFQANKPSD